MRSVCPKATTLSLKSFFHPRKPAIMQLGPCMHAPVYHWLHKRTCLPRNLAAW
jgi:hypothetical protein